ncbi:MAG: hypothetical protein ABMA00_05440 [Gemmatimonas sp.]
MRSQPFARALRTAAFIATLAPVGLLLGQPAKSRPASNASSMVTYVKVLGADYAFESPDLVASGIVAFNLVNNGADLHAMAVFELPAKHTLREFLDQYHTQGMIPAWMIGIGQTPTIAPNTEAFLTVRIKPGRYILACLIPARDGRMHTEKGMVKLITVK